MSELPFTHFRTVFSSTLLFSDSRKRFISKEYAGQLFRETENDVSVGSFFFPMNEDAPVETLVPPVEDSGRSSRYCPVPLVGSEVASLVLVSNL